MSSAPQLKSFLFFGDCWMDAEAQPPRLLQPASLCQRLWVFFGGASQFFFCFLCSFSFFPIIAATFFCARRWFSVFFQRLFIGFLRPKRARDLLLWESGWPWNSWRNYLCSAFNPPQQQPPPLPSPIFGCSQTHTHDGTNKKNGNENNLSQKKTKKKKN